MEQQILQKLHTKLLRMLPGQDLAPFFYQDGLLTLAEYEELQTKATMNDKNQHILASLGRRPLGMLSDLISCLEKQITVPGVKEILQHIKEAMNVCPDKSADGAVGGASPIGSADDLSSSEGELLSSPEPIDFEDTPLEESSSEFDPSLQLSEILAPEERIALPDHEFPVQAHGIVKFAHGVQHCFLQYFSFEDHGPCYTEFCNKKPPTDHFSAFRVALGYLQVLWKHHKIQTSVDFVKFSKSLEIRRMQIAFTGRNNAGKSTLLNAMMGDEMLPINRRPETAVRVFVRHDDTRARTGPQLILQLGKGEPDEVANGRDMILQYMRTRNGEVRSLTKKDRQEQIRKDERVILHLDMPLLSSKSSQVYLVDTPGFAAPDQAHLDDAAGKILRASAAYVLLISYHQLSNTGDLSILDELKTLDRAVSSDQRLIIAVTQHDMSYAQSGNGEMSSSETIEFVSKNLEGLGHLIAESQIIPVSGKWALTARKLKKDPRNRTLLKEARRALADYQDFQEAQRVLTKYKDSQACGEDYQSINPTDVHQMDPEAISIALEEASNIRALESSIKRVIDDCDSVVRKNATSKIGYWLQEALKELCDEMMKKDAEFDSTRTKATHVQRCLDDISKKKKELQVTITKKETDVYQTFVKKCNLETKKPYAKVKDLIPERLKILKYHCLEECRKTRKECQKTTKETYSTQHLNEEMKTYLERVLSPAVQAEVKEGCIEQTRQVCKAYLATYVPDQFRVMRDTACDLPTPSKGGKTWKLPGATLNSVIGGIEEALILGTFLTDHDIQEPIVIEWGWWDKFKAVFRVLMNKQDHGDPDSIKEVLLCSGPDMHKIPVSPERIEQMIDALTDFLMERTDEYFQSDNGIQKVVVKGFHDDYSKCVQQGLHDFDEVFGATIVIEQDNLKKMRQQMKALGIERNDLMYFIKALENLRKDWFEVAIAS